MSALKVFTCTDHDGRYPVGVASVIVAADIEHARDLLDAELGKNGLRLGGYSLDELALDRPHAEILCDGDY
jgi:hypothetical protein